MRLVAYLTGGLSLSIWEKYRGEMKLNCHTSEQEALHPVAEDKYHNKKRTNKGEKIIVRSPFGSEIMPTPF